MSAILHKVDRLTIQILVDNSIEWFTKLPPGFTHEYPQHLQHTPPMDTRTGVPIVDLDNFCCGAHGLSILLVSLVQKFPGVTYSLVFDTGPDARAFERNYASLDVTNLASIERIVLSHWHRDHSGAITTLVKLLKDSKEGSVIVDLHPDRPLARGIAPPPYDKTIARLPDDPSFEEIEAAGAQIELSCEGHVVGDGAVWVSGEIPRITEFEGGLLGGMRWFEDEHGKGAWRAEPGLVIFSACSHAGIINVVRDAINKFSRPIHMIIGGLHPAPAEPGPPRPPTVDSSTKQLRPAPTYILPLHCSGFQAKIAFEKALGDGCVPGGVGMKIEVQGDPSGEEHIASLCIVSPTDKIV
ncbi:hypothetical protein K439DRAFT_1644495 [Ramaria rubella]|nr:hypothetical protein K439DRAFT_1644495 [Ramaria rubella]